MKIVDAHHHFWDPVANDHPWLREDPMIPFRYGDYSSIRRRFMLDDYDRATEGWDVVATVTMEGEWTPSDPTRRSHLDAAPARRHRPPGGPCRARLGWTAPIWTRC